MHRIRLLVLALPILLIACGGSSIDDLRNGIPSSDTVQLNVPKQPGQALEMGQAQQAAQGQTAHFYQVTREVTDLVNGATGLVLLLVKSVTDNPPTSFNGHVAVWGPYTAPLSSNTYRLTVTDLGHHQYTYVLEGKAKWDPDSAFVAILTGTHNAATDSHGRPIRGFGNGSFIVNWDAAHSLPDPEDNVGTGEFTYSRLSPVSPVEIDVTFTQVLDRTTLQRVNATYRYVSAPGGDGMFQFSTFNNPGATMIRLSIESRWKNNGAGRADVEYIIGNPTPATAETANECWDELFLSQYFHSSQDPSQDYGKESNCAFSPAEYSPL
ncbi:MAG TPA: hypothetical protein VFV14_11915 [Myxococcaceae bacterium]|nr:hypothetical protein [Myxococcaceae bacterium]